MLTLMLEQLLVHPLNDSACHPVFLTHTTHSLCTHNRTYSEMAGEETAKKYQQAIYLAGSASAEFFADIALCPFEATKVRECSLA